MKSTLTYIVSFWFLVMTFKPLGKSAYLLYELFVKQSLIENGFVVDVEKNSSFHGTFFHCKLKYTVASASYQAAAVINATERTDVKIGDPVPVRYSVADPAINTTDPYNELLVDSCVLILLIFLNVYNVRQLYITYRGRKSASVHAKEA